ncbi:hypothetical protein KCP74_13000 [Salmonella enterica subsp. enterica]|nr:hypothetical protein KCP74_13000 [Salmonella enterica subsp. enterica]
MITNQRLRAVFREKNNSTFGEHTQPTLINKRKEIEMKSLRLTLLALRFGALTGCSTLCLGQLVCRK